MRHKRKSAEMEAAEAEASSKWDYVLDPRGDTILILTNPDTPWDGWTEEANLDRAYRCKSEGSESDSADNEPAVKKKNPPSSAGTSTTAPAKEQYTYLVSSRHLKLASPYFEASRKVFADSNRYDGLFRDTFSDYDHEAFLIALQIIHTRHAELPKAVPIVLLAKVALLVHDFDILGPASFCMNAWIAHIADRKSLPWHDAKMQVLWLFIIWVARHREQCRDTFGYIIEEGKHAGYPDLGLPVPKSLINACLSARLELMTRLCNRYRGLINRLVVMKEPGMGQCTNPTCAAFLLGAFYTALASQSIDLCALREPFEGRTYDSMKVKFIYVIDGWLPKHPKPVCHIRTITRELMAQWEKDKAEMVEKAWERLVQEETWLREDE